MKLSLSESFKNNLKNLAGLSLNENHNAGLNQIMDLAPEKFYKLIDLLEADITAYGYDDLNYYEQVTGIDIGQLMDLYNQYGFKHHKYESTTALKNNYCQKKRNVLG